jgi:hypothetical protein
MNETREGQLFKKPGMIRRKARWIKERKDSSHLSFKKISQAYQQGKPTQGEHKMIDSLGKRPRQHPIKCWRCEGDHLYKYCPHKGDRLRIVHNIQEVGTIDDVGMSMPRIYGTLDNRQVDINPT